MEKHIVIYFAVTPVLTSTTKCRAAHRRVSPATADPTAGQTKGRPGIRGLLQIGMETPLNYSMFSSHCCVPREKMLTIQASGKSVYIYITALSRPALSYWSAASTSSQWVWGCVQTEDRLKQRGHVPLCFVCFLLSSKENQRVNRNPHSLTSCPPLSVLRCVLTSDL